MASTGFESVDHYIAAEPAPVRAVLDRVRATIRKAVPSAEESISYGIPTYKLHGRPVLYFAGWAQHFSLYPVGAEIIAALEGDLARYEVKKSTIRFPFSEPVPVKLIERIAKFRAKALADRVTQGGAYGKKSPAHTPAPEPGKSIPPKARRRSAS
jgi:uncharacterized protein YdhG (YjbR/CyaY superfamily)